GGRGPAAEAVGDGVGGVAVDERARLVTDARGVARGVRGEGGLGAGGGVAGADEAEEGQGRGGGEPRVRGDEELGAGAPGVRGCAARGALALVDPRSAGDAEGDGGSGGAGGELEGEVEEVVEDERADAGPRGEDEGGAAPGAGGAHGGPGGEGEEAESGGDAELGGELEGEVLRVLEGEGERGVGGLP